MTNKVLVAVFETQDAVLAAAKAARKSGLTVRDAHTPFPVHGMDEALGLAPSWLSKACFALGALGFTLAVSFQYWVSLFNWPMNIGGKSFDASPALVPIAFELTVLVAGVGTVLALLVSRGLFPGRNPDFADLGATDDKFLLVFEVESEAAVREFSRRHGASSVVTAQGGAR